MESKQPESAVVKNGNGDFTYYGKKSHTVNCKVGKHELKVEFYTEKPRLQGECGGAPGSNVWIYIDGEQIHSAQLFNDDCHESFNRFSFNQAQDKYYVKVCGHNYNSEGCMTLESNKYQALINRTDHFPFSTLLEKTPLDLSPAE